MSDVATLESLSLKMDRIILSIDGDDKDVIGLRPRMKAVETGVERLANLVENEKLVSRVEILEKLVESMNEERNRSRAWIAGLAVGLGIAGPTSVAAFVMQLLKSVPGGP